MGHGYHFIRRPDLAQEERMHPQHMKRAVRARETAYTILMQREIPVRLETTCLEAYAGFKEPVAGKKIKRLRTIGFVLRNDLMAKRGYEYDPKTNSLITNDDGVPVKNGAVQLK